MELHFPEGFLWGTATAAHQVEGGNTNNDWWAWEQAGGHIRDGSRSGLACDWWNRAEEDFDRAQQLGQNTLRLSVEWSRLEPRPGEWNRAAVQRYRHMLEGLRQRGLEPMVTLYHFTLPMWLANMGGWANPSAITYFGRFAERVVEELGDLVSLWCTINEPAIYALQAYKEGVWPPGQRNFPLAMKVLRHLLIAHGEVYRRIHALRGDAQVGLVKNMIYAEPLRRHSRADRMWASFFHRLFNILPLDAVTEGKFKMPLGYGRSSKLMDSVDFIGVNYYTRMAFSVDRRDLEASMSFHLMPGGEISDGGYGEIYPLGFYSVLKQAHRYGKPIYVTENGVPDHDDDVRPRFILTHLAQLWRAMQEGVPVRGYYHWSLVDNFEWAYGYALRFGLIEVDFATQERRIRTSGRLYSEICQANAITEDLVRRYAPEAMDAVFGVSAANVRRVT